VLLGVPGRGDVIGVFLGIAFRHQEAVVAAAAARIFPADGGPRLIDGAAALFGIEEAADLAEMGVGLAAHGIGLVAIDLGKFLARGLEAQPEMAGKPLEAMALIGLGLRTLSMQPANIGPVKMMIRSIDSREVAQFVNKLCGRTDHSLRTRLAAFAAEHGIVVK